MTAAATVGAAMTAAVGTTAENAHPPGRQCGKQKKMQGKHCGMFVRQRNGNRLSATALAWFLRPGRIILRCPDGTMTVVTTEIADAIN